MMWNVEEGLNQIDKFFHDGDDFVKSGACLGTVSLLYSPCHDFSARILSKDLWYLVQNIFSLSFFFLFCLLIYQIPYPFLFPSSPGVGIISSGVRNESDAALALLTDYLDDSAAANVSTNVRTASAMGLGA